MPDVLSCIAPGLFAHASGALWLADIQTAVIADLHFGYSWAQRRRGELGPLVDDRARDKLLQFRDELSPLQIVFLGDIVHAPRACAPEREATESLIRELARKARLVAVGGNHDRRFGSEFAHLPCETVESWSHEALLMVHGDRSTPRLDGQTLVVGHLHPALSVRDNSGAGRRLPVFLVGTGCIVLPAFSPFARGYEIIDGLPEQLKDCFGTDAVQVYATTGKRVVPLGSLSSALRAIAEGDTTSAAQFRRGRR